MALNLLYRSTFLDVEETVSCMDISRSAGKPRSRSAPHSFRGEPDEATKMSTSALAQRAQQLHTLLRVKGQHPGSAPFQRSSQGSCSDEASTMDATMSVVDKVPKAAKLPPQGDLDVLAQSSLVSRGSVGHPEICRRPCLFFAAGTCTNGRSCEYCHLPHDQRAPHLDKRQRMMVDRMTEKDLVALVLHHLQAKAAVQGFESEAAEIEGLLRHKVGLPPGIVPMPASIPRQSVPKLTFMMQKMTFQALVGLVMKSAYASEDIVEQLSGALMRMRATLSAAAA